MARRFPIPWTVHNNDSAYWLEDAEGKQFAFTYFRDDRSGLVGNAYHTRDEARRITVNLVKLPGFLEKK